MLQIPNNIGYLQRAVDTSHILKKISEYYEDTPGIVKEAAAIKSLVDAEIFLTIKKAGVATSATNTLPKIRNLLLRKGLSGAALTIPPAVAGWLLLNKAKENAKDLSADTRNKVIQSGLALALTAAGMYGLHKTMGATNDKKVASYHDAGELHELVEKLAAVQRLDDKLDQIDIRKLSKEAQDATMELGVLNRGYGVHLLYEATHR